MKSENFSLIYGQWKNQQLQQQRNALPSKHLNKSKGKRRKNFVYKSKYDSTANWKTQRNRNAERSVKMYAEEINLNNKLEVISTLAESISAASKKKRRKKSCTKYVFRSAKTRNCHEWTKVLSRIIFFPFLVHWTHFAKWKTEKSNINATRSMMTKYFFPLVLSFYVKRPIDVLHWCLCILFVISLTDSNDGKRFIYW